MIATPSRPNKRPSTPLRTPLSYTKTETWKTPSRRSSSSAKTPISIQTALSRSAAPPSPFRRTTPARPYSGDRFIPNRATTNIDLCKSALQSVEKRRTELIPKAAATLLQRQKSEEPALTPQDHQKTLQAHYNRRMKSTLFDIPLEALEEPVPATSSVGTLSSSSRDSSDLSFLETLSISDLEKLAGEAAGSGNARRLLSFRGSEPSPRTEIAADPFAHDQLRVLQRSSMKSSIGRALSINGEDLDASGTKRQSVTARKRPRPRPSQAIQVLDAPNFVNDFYLNLTSYNQEHNLLAVGLADQVYIYNATSGAVSHLMTASDSFGETTNAYVTSLAWLAEKGDLLLAIGTSYWDVELWDPFASKRVRTLTGHGARVASLAWNGKWLASGDKEGVIFQHDILSPCNTVARYESHRDEVCGLAWNADGTTLASSSRDTTVCLWDVAISQRSESKKQRLRGYLTVEPRKVFQDHQSSVKALAWCPFRRDLLASGGGISCKTIKFWSSHTDSLVRSVNTGSQVTSLVWSPHAQELVSAHGSGQLSLWKYAPMTKIQDFSGHEDRVVGAILGERGQVVSVGGDETIRFWDIFGVPPRKVDRFDRLDLHKFTIR